MLRSNRFALEIIVIGVYIYDNGSPALMGWLAFHAIVVIVFLLCFLVLWKINLLSLSLVLAIRASHFLVILSQGEYFQCNTFTSARRFCSTLQSTLQCHNFRMKGHTNRGFVCASQIYYVRISGGLCFSIKF